MPGQLPNAKLIAANFFSLFQRKILGDAKIQTSPFRSVCVCFTKKKIQSWNPWLCFCAFGFGLKRCWRCVTKTPNWGFSRCWACHVASALSFFPWSVPDTRIDVAEWGRGPMVYWLLQWLLLPIFSLREMSCLLAFVDEDRFYSIYFVQGQGTRWMTTTTDIDLFRPPHFQPCGQIFLQLVSLIVHKRVLKLHMKSSHSVPTNCGHVW